MMDMDTVSPNPDGYGSTFAPMDIHPYPSIPSSAQLPAFLVVAPVVDIASALDVAVGPGFL
jgi:hypothetical protein